MKYVAISILTTGVNPIKNDILEFGAVIEDVEENLPIEECPALRMWIDKEFYRGNPYALAANKHVLDKITELRSAKSRRLVVPDDVWSRFSKFLQSHFASTLDVFSQPIPVAGKNFSSFELLFLRRLKNFLNIPLLPRVIEPTNLFIDWKSDVLPPTLAECCRRAGVNPEIPADTLEICRSVIQVLRTRYQHYTFDSAKEINLSSESTEVEVIPAIELEN